MQAGKTGSSNNDAKPLYSGKGGQRRGAGHVSPDALQREGAFHPCPPGASGKLSAWLWFVTVVSMEISPECTSYDIV